MGDTSSWRDRGKRELLLRAVSRMTSIEQRLYGAMVLRQLQTHRNIDAEYTKYGPDGTVARCCSRANAPYLFVLIVVMTPFAATGHYDVAVPLYGGCFVFFVAAVTQTLKSRRLGRSWRTHSGSP